MSVDPSQLKFSPHTGYYLTFFILKTRFMMNGQLAQVTSDDGHLTLSCRYPPVSITFDSLIDEVDTVVKKYGLEGVSNYWCEEVPLFELKLPSQRGLREFLRLEDQVQNELAARVAAALTQRQQSADPIVVYAHTEVHMLTPRPERKDAEVSVVKSENVDSCATIWRESEVFNFGSLYRALRIDRKTIAEVTLALLDQELHEVSEWFGLGLHLGVPVSDLQAIEYNPALRSIPQFRMEMLTARMRNLPELSWSHAVLALMAVGRERLAQKIALKYGVPVPASVQKKLPQLDTTSQMLTPLQQELSGKIEKLSKEVETKDRELAVKDLAFQEARRQKSAVHQKLFEIKHTVGKTQLKTMKLIEQKMEVEKHLLLREQELQFLRTGHQKDSEQLRSIIQNKEEEVQELRHRLLSVENELASERKVTLDLREKLLQASAALAEKSALVQEREKVTEVFKILLEGERQRVDQLVMQLTSASTSRDQYIREIEHQLSNTRVECQSNAKESVQHKLTIAQREGEIKGLQLQLHNQEALIRKLEQQSAVGREGSAKQQLELEQKLFQVTSEVAELREKLEKAKEGKQDAVREMEAASVKSEVVQRRMAELGEQTRVGLDPSLPLPPQPRPRPLPRPRPRPPPRSLPPPPSHLPPPSQLPPPSKLPPPSQLPPPSRMLPPAAAHPSSALQLPLNLRWRQYKDLPRGRESPYCVIVEGKLYIGGGSTGSDDDHTVWQYESEQWLKLTQYEYEWFTMTSLRGHLTLVGGVAYTLPLLATNVIAVWDRKWLSHRWTHPYPPMPTPRYSPAVATHNQWLLVAGGRGDIFDAELAAVDLLNTDNRQWLSTTPLPVECCHVTAAIVQEQLYLVGGTLTTTLVVSLPDLLSIDSANTTKIWRTLPAPPLERSAAISVRGALLAVGGCHGNDRSTAIHIYQPATNNWEKVGDLPSARSHCTCTLLPSGELLTAGGLDSNGKRTSQVDVAAM